MSTFASRLACRQRQETLSQEYVGVLLSITVNESNENIEASSTQPATTTPSGGRASAPLGRQV